MPDRRFEKAFERAPAGTLWEDVKPPPTVAHLATLVSLLVWGELRPAYALAWDPDRAVADGVLVAAFPDRDRAEESLGGVLELDPRVLEAWVDRVLEGSSQGRDVSLVRRVSAVSPVRAAIKFLEEAELEPDPAAIPKGRVDW